MALIEQTLVYAAQTAVGQVRGHNEDAVLCCPELNLWAVADGMGGHRRGEVASALALQALRSACAEGQDLLGAVHAANCAVLEAAEADAECRGMGTTLVAVRFTGADFQIAWVGDSRAYRIDTDSISGLSRDHSWVQSMIDVGEMSIEEARDHPQRNVIFQCLGRDDQVLEVGLVQGSLGAHELLLLCSDGLTGELTDLQIQQVCAGASNLDELVEQLITLANQLGGRDNISCIVLGRDAAEPVAAAQPRGFLSKLFKPLTK
ncbi:phosphoprotein phosphatase [Pseudomonas taeanensis MS-3]|uniref:Phosphoprotein phosphatase n=1 Tax=Pseudomonas taeanensis MS-3 TaxID=1395571 RepID=A0A0A1YLV8_9PSED|nr:protein phosphatase 2C domain-containing protein [Pseudomonas taeanensis]KFX70076.1 phosphoprotein phosphatase [Pseudomonas taeanensis MS-3]